MWWNSKKKADKKVDGMFEQPGGEPKYKPGADDDVKKQEIIDKLQDLSRNLDYYDLDRYANRVTDLMINFKRIKNEGDHLVLRTIDNLLLMTIKICDDFARRKNEEAIEIILSDIDTLINDRASCDIHYKNKKLVEMIIMKNNLVQQLEKVITQKRDLLTLGNGFCAKYNDPNYVGDKRTLYTRIEDIKDDRKRLEGEENVVRQQITAIKEAIQALKNSNYYEIIVDDDEFNTNMEEAMEKAANNHYNAEKVDNYLNSLKNLNNKPTKKDVEVPSGIVDQTVEDDPLPAHMSMDN